MRKEVVARAEIAAEERVLDALVGDTASADTRQKFRTMLRQGELDDREVEIEIAEGAGMTLPTADIPGMPGAQMGMMRSTILPSVVSGSTSVRGFGRPQSMEVM